VQEQPQQTEQQEQTNQEKGPEPQRMGPPLSQSDDEADETDEEYPPKQPPETWASRREKDKYSYPKYTYCTPGTRGNPHMEMLYNIPEWVPAAIRPNIRTHNPIYDDPSYKPAKLSAVEQEYWRNKTNLYYKQVAQAQQTEQPQRADQPQADQSPHTDPADDVLMNTLLNRIGTQYDPADNDETDKQIMENIANKSSDDFDRLSALADRLEALNNNGDIASNELLHEIASHSSVPAVPSVPASPSVPAVSSVLTDSSELHSATSISSDSTANTTAGVDSSVNPVNTNEVAVANVPDVPDIRTEFKWHGIKGT
jgi:hypothetical protein